MSPCPSYWIKFFYFYDSLKINQQSSQWLDKLNFQQKTISMHQWLDKLNFQQKTISMRTMCATGQVISHSTKA